MTEIDLEAKLNRIGGDRYKSTKGDADKRKQTSRENMAKAREVKFKKQQEKVDDEEVEITDSDDDYVSSSDEELVITKKPKKSIKKEGGGLFNEKRIARLEKAIYNLSVRANKPKKTVIEKKTIINMPQTPTSAQNPHKQQLLNLI